MTAPVFMSPPHIEAMNEILAAATAVHETCRDLDRRYAVCYDLHDGPDGDLVHWSMVFDPGSGVRMGLARVPDADVTMVGDWAEAIRAAEASRRGESYDPGWDVVGDAGVFETVGDAFTEAHRVAAIEVTFPDVSGDRA